MRDLATEPAFTEADLGMPLPKTRHACSTCLPSWNSVLGYEKKLAKVMRALQAGYPRFVLHPATERLFQVAQSLLAENGTRVVVFPSKESAQRAQRFVEKRTGSASRIASFEGLQALIVSEDDYSVAMEYWRYTGEVVSSRQAEHILSGKDSNNHNPVSLRKRLARLGNYRPEKVFIYENGMAAMYSIYRAANKLLPGRKTLQLEFPYVDAMRVQRHLGNGVVYLNEAVGESLDEALSRIAKGEFSAVFCEAPSNPLMRTVDIPRVSRACRDGGVPFVIDDTICSTANVRVDQYADVVVSSLTKWISGKGDVMAGQITICNKSPFLNDLMEFYGIDCPDGSRLYASDARILARNISGFSSRMKKCNDTAELVADFLKAHPAIENVWYPKFTTPDTYEAIRREGGGYGGLISFVLKNRKKTPRFYDALRISKGPSLGTEFSLACPYTMLAHYDEMEWVEGCGLDKYLIRISIGVEDADDLLTRVAEALKLA